MQFSHFFPNADELTPLPEGGEQRVNPVKKRRYCIKSMGNWYDLLRICLGRFIWDHIETQKRISVWKTVLKKQKNVSGI